MFINQELVTNLRPCMQKPYTGVNVFIKIIPVLGKTVFLEQDSNHSVPVSYHSLLVSSKY